MVDTNVIAYLFLEGERTPQAERILEADPEWAAPMLWRSEFLSVLARYLRLGIISLEVAVSMAQESERLLEGNEFEVSSGQVLELTRKSQCSAYDCQFVALAQDLNVHMVTSDKRILREFPSIAISMEKYIC